MSCVGWMPRLRARPFSGGGQLGHQLADAGRVRDPLGAADLKRRHALELGRAHPVGDGAHVLGRLPVGAQQRHFLEVLDARGVDRRRRPRGAQLAFAQPPLGQLDAVVEEVRLEEHAVEGHAQARERLALAGDHPRARLEPQLKRLALAAASRV